MDTGVLETWTPTFITFSCSIALILIFYIRAAGGEVVKKLRKGVSRWGLGSSVLPQWVAPITYILLWSPLNVK